jgi:putative glutamine amidotransferase
MQKFLLLLFSFFVFNSAFCQHFFDGNFDEHKKYIILCDPTIDRIETIQYLTTNHIFKVKKNVEFVGVYYKNQKYDFSKTQNYIKDHQLSEFHLQEVSGELTLENLFNEKNPVTDELKKIFDNSIGVFFFGGPDIPPAIYGDKNTLSVVTDPERHYFECSFMFHLLGGYQNESYVPFLTKRPDYVVTGFCLGLQTMNVGTGGTLIQDIPSEVYGANTPEETVEIGQANLHRNYWQLISEDSLLSTINLHTIHFSDNPLFGDKVKISKQETPLIYSAHHQAIKKLGKGLEVTAMSPDYKIIEGVVHEKFQNVFSVQFHPEVSALYENKYKRKFTPDGEPQYYHEMLGKDGVKFHKAYWKCISKAFRTSK